MPHCAHFLSIHLLRRSLVAGLLMAGMLACVNARAYVVAIATGSRALYLQVGAGSITGGTYNAGGVPGNNATVNLVSTTVATGAVGNGTAQGMTSNSVVSTSPVDGYANYCTPASGQVYVGGFYRTPGTAANATLSVNTPLNLLNASGNTLPFSSLSWTTSGLGDASPSTIPNGTFAGGTTQTLLSVSRNTWFESCLTFRYNNAQMVAAGTFAGRATYTLTAP